jgi:hypothetical protein
MLTTLEWLVTLVLTMRIRVFRDQWAMVLRPFGPEWGRILQVENFVFLSVQKPTHQLTFINCKLDAGNSDGIKLMLTETKKMSDGHPRLTTDI